LNIEFPYNFITIEGNIGSGKTTFCKKIKEEYNCQLVLEEFDDNPFLPLFYEDQDRWAFTVELFFMTERYKQMQKEFVSRDMFVDFTITDYAFVKTLLFARQNLEEGEFKMFQKLFNTLNQSFPQPELLVYFHRSVEHLQANIAKRGREYEKNISDEYLTKVQNSYFEYFRNILSYPILIIDLNTINFEENERNYQEVKMLLAKKYNPGVHRISLMV